MNAVVTVACKGPRPVLKYGVCGFRVGTDRPESWHCPQCGHYNFDMFAAASRSMQKSRNFAAMYGLTPKRLSAIVGA